MNRYNLGDIQVQGYDALISKMSSLSKGDYLSDGELINIIANRGLELLKTYALSANFKFGTGENMSTGMNKKILSISRTLAEALLYNDNPEVAFQEFGTGVVGRDNPNPNASLVGWVYDDREEGWWYPVEDENDIPEGQPKRNFGGTWYAWTKGQVAQNVFYDTIEQLKREIPEICTEYMQNYMKGA